MANMNYRALAELESSCTMPCVVRGEKGKDMLIVRIDRLDGGRSYMVDDGETCAYHNSDGTVGMVEEVQ